MPQAGFGELFTRMKHCAFGENFTKLKQASYFKNGQFHKVWSGASTVYYYDGSTLLGTEEVDEGEDVLHPSFSTAKEGYTLYGWRYTESDTSRIEQLVATGETMILQAYYLANTLTVVSNGSILNSQYVTGSVSASARASYNQQFADEYFTLDKKKYQTATCVAYAYWDNHSTQYMNVGSAQLDTAYIGTDTNYGGSQVTQTFNDFGNGQHHLHLWVVSYNSYWQNGGAYIQSLVLSNPIAWE